MNKTNKSLQIVHEAELTRQHARYKIPAIFEINEKEYKVFDWSVSGVGIIDIDKEVFYKKFAVGKMKFKFDDFETVIDNLHIEFISERNQDGKIVAGARFTDLTPQQISILNQIISAYLAGDIITEDDIIHAVSRAQFTTKKEKKPKVDKKKSILVLLLLWIFILFLVLFLLYVMYQRIYIVKTENSYFDTNMTIIRAPAPSYIEFNKKSVNKKCIIKGEVLYYSHLIYGGVKVVKSPLSGINYKVNVKNNDFRNVGEPVISIVDKNARIYIVAKVLHKNIRKIKLGDIATVKLPNGDEFFAKVIKIEFSYKIIEQHSKPLENVYNQPRNYDDVILYPINYKPSLNLIGTSATVVIDTLLNKYNWYKLDDENISNYVEFNKTCNIAKIEENNLSQSITLENNEIFEKNESKETNNTKNTQSTNNEKISDKYIKRYCIIATSSYNDLHKNEKVQSFISKYPNAKIIKVKNIYELKIENFKTVKKAKKFIIQNIEPYFKDAFIIKCKVKVNG